MGVDEIHLGKQQKFITVVSNLETGEPLWFGRERKKETLDQFFQEELSVGQRRRIEAGCVAMWEPYRQSIHPWSPRCRIVYDKFHILQHANAAVDEGAASGVLSARGKETRTDPRQTVVTAESLEELGEPAPR
jgi:transposase